ncbi:hypothetical protein ONZ45_g15471 [Pleurotus djamor]|nr:hypothetical protein ONZ45_g15471 [Pleurotus djamor]
MTNQQITLYTNKGSPYGQYVEIALLEAKLPFTRVEVDLNPKPSWLASLNHLDKIPVLTYGGPSTSPDQPSKESNKFGESVALIELINDLVPEAQLLGRDPVERAQARFFIQFLVTAFSQSVYGFILRKGPVDEVFKAFRQLQGFLPDEKDEGKFILGDKFSLGDAVAAGFILRANTYFGNDLGTYPEGEGRKVFGWLQNDAEFAKYRAYVRTLKKRSTVVETYPEEYHLTIMEKYGVSR